MNTAEERWLKVKIGNPIQDSTIYTLKHVYRKSKKPIWRAVVEELLKPKSKRRHINLGKISRSTKKGDVILVPGKVLGGGKLSHSLVIGAYSYSQTALQKISKARGKPLFLADFAEKYADGKDVKLIG